MTAKYSYDFRLTAVRYYLEGNAGTGGTASHFGISRTNLKRWVAMFLQHGEQALSPRSCYQRYSAEFKLQVVRYALSHSCPPAVVAAHFNIFSCATVESWVRRYKLKGLHAFFPLIESQEAGMTDKSKKRKVADEMTHKELLKELEYLRAENDYLKVMQEIILEKKRRDLERKQRE